MCITDLLHCKLPVNGKTIKMKYAKFYLGPDVKLYVVKIPNYYTGNILYSVTVNDTKANNDSTRIDVSFAYVPKAYEFYNSSGSTYVKNHFNGILVTSKVSNLNVNNRTGDIEIDFNGRYINETNFIPYHWYPNTDLLVPTIYGNVDGANVAENRVEDYFRLPVMRFQDSLNTSSFTTNNASSRASSISIAGDSSRFPFDHYFVSLVLQIPLNHTSFTYSGQYDKSVNSSWVPFINGSALNSTQIMRQYSKLNSLKCDAYRSPTILNNCIYLGYSLRNPLEYKYYTWLNIFIDFKRNYSVAAITIPIVAIFYLLGANFVMRTNQLPNRLAITLGVFAFLFAFIPIVNQMKPPTTTNVPTIADLLITLILTATITYTVSSVIASSPVIRNKFSKESILIDGVAFLLVSAVAIGYIISSSFPFDILIWLTPTVLFGLGYGLLLRLLFRSSVVQPDKSTTVKEAS
jgi:hypothetical protein